MKTGKENKEPSELPPVAPLQVPQQQQPLPPLHLQLSHLSLDASNLSLEALLQKYPVRWQGRVALKNDEAGVQMHFVFGNDTLGKTAMELAAPNTSRRLKILQRMRIEPPQLAGLQGKMSNETEFCMLLTVACGGTVQDYRNQTLNLREAFIKYLQEKQSAGIVNVHYSSAVEHQLPVYVAHIFPPGPFATDKLKQYASDLYANLYRQPNSETPYLLVVVTTV